jgi:hypothetical protein
MRETRELECYLNGFLTFLMGKHSMFAERRYP